MSGAPPLTSPGAPTEGYRRHSLLSYKPEQVVHWNPVMSLGDLVPVAFLCHILAWVAGSIRPMTSLCLCFLPRIPVPQEISILFSNPRSPVAHATKQRGSPCPAPPMARILPLQRPKEGRCFHPLHFQNETSNIA